MHQGAMQYRRLNAQTAIVDASPHRLIQMMLDGAINRIGVALHQLEVGNPEAKWKSVDSALEIVGALQACLDHEKGGELSRNLDQLYHYIQYRLFRANVDNDASGLTEVTGLLGEIKAGWDAIEPVPESPEAAPA